MKITSLLTYAATTALAVFAISLFASQDAMNACAVFAMLVFSLIAIQEYRPRSRFVVTVPTRARNTNSTLRKTRGASEKIYAHFPKAKNEISVKAL